MESDKIKVTVSKDTLTKEHFTYNIPETVTEIPCGSPVYILSSNV